ncbi:class I SAM-dependent methyltransferase [Candidatus Woesearchaeota archaeon]|nr:class I SAM-dependent methyltransferase [Candidatus Woesearchaeota archaeon]
MTTFKDVEQYYNQCYKKDKVGVTSAFKVAEGVRPFEAYEYVLNSLNLDNGKGLKLLDIACGRGFLLKAASSKGFEISGIDISKEAIELAKLNVPNASLKVGAAEKLPFKDNYFDVVFCLGSLEHFLDQEKAISEIKRVSKKDSRLFIMVPNKDFILFKFTNHEGTHQSEIQETLRTNNEWVNLFRKNGLSISKTLADDYNFKQRIFFDYRPLFVIRRSLLKVLGLFIPLKFSYQFLYCCKKN